MMGNDNFDGIGQTAAKSTLNSHWELGGATLSKNRSPAHTQVWAPSVSASTGVLLQSLPIRFFQKDEILEEPKRHEPFLAQPEFVCAE